MALAATSVFLPSAEKVSDREIDDLVAKARKAWGVPGLAVAIVRDDKVIYLKGFGVTKVDTKDDVTPDTIFPLASCTKAFTTTAMAILVDEKKMAWDDPVRKYVPFFHLSDPLADDKVTLRDLVCHRTGVAPHDLLWHGSNLDRDERIKRLKHLPLKHGFRTTMQYQSSMYTVAGAAVEAASKRPWDEFVQKRLFDPLGMKQSACTTPQARKLGTVASPHRISDRGQVVPMPPYEMDKPEPAGSIYSSARDLAAWLRLQLSNGKFDGKQIVSARSLQETHEPQIVVRMEGLAKYGNPETQQISYGMGWVIQDYRGELVVQHGGTIDGYRAHLTLLPKQKIGIALLNNLHRTQLNIALSNSLIDRLLGMSYLDWDKLVGKAMETAGTEFEAKRTERDKNRKTGTKPSLPLKDYAGTYEHGAYGSMRIEVNSSKLIWRYRNLKCELEHYENDVFRIHHEMLPDCLVEFRAADGKVKSMRMGEPMEIDFERR